MKTSRVKLLFNLIISFLYAYRLSSVPSELLSDRVNYSVWYKYADERLSSISSVLSFLSKEPLFYLLNKALSFLNDPFLALQVISFFICFLFCFFALNFVKNRYVSLVFILFFFFDLNILSLQLNALRHGVALGLMMLFFQKKEKITYLNIIIFSFILGLIHFSFFLIATLLLIDWWLSRKPETITDVKRISTLIIISVILSISALSVVSFFGAKQAASFEEGPSTVSGLGFVYWALIFMYVWFKKPRYYEDNKMKFAHSLFIIIMVFYLSSYFIMPVFGRLINLAFPFLLLILLYKPKPADVLIVFIFFSQALYTFFYSDKFSVYIYMTQKTFIQYILGVG